MGKYFEIKLESKVSEEKAKEQIKQMCEKLLVNSVIEDYCRRAGGAILVTRRIIKH